MKKLFALICCLFISPAIANIHIEPEILESVLQEYMPDTDSRLAAYREYNSQLKTANGAGIPAAGVWYVCNAAGWDIKQSAGKDKCTKFTETLIERATWSFKAVCGDDKKMIGARTGRCIDNFFSNKVAGGTRVNMLIATGLAKEYARVKFNDDSLICNKEARTNKVDDFVQCLSVKQNMAYEFKFDSVTASIDVTITEGTESAICRMYDTKYIISGHEGDRANYHYWRAACDTANKNLCEKINNSMERFGRSAKIGKTGPRSNERDACVIKTEKSASNLRTAFGIDNYVFKNGGVQLQATSGLTEQLCTYIRNNVTDPKITSCKCDDGYTQIYDFSGIVTETDDVLTCYANNQPIDFVFDDLSEHNKTIAKGGLESFNCTVLGGEYQGKTCYTPDKDLCDKIAAATLSECPECAKAYYDEKLKSCVLPNSTNAVQKQKRTNTYLIIGGTLVGAAVVIYTGGTGAVYVAMAVETVGGAMELISQHHIDGVADEFFVKANNCNDATCAESILKEFFQYLSRMTNDLDSSELSGIDTQMARLIGLLPDDSQFMTDVVGACYEKNNVNNDNFNIVACDDGIWNPDQIVRAVGIALQFTSVFASVGKWVLGAGRVQKIAKQTPKLTNALQHKISGVKDVVAKKLAQGKSVKLSNGKNIATKAKTATKTPATTTTESAKVDNVMQKATDIEKNERAMVSKADMEDFGKRYEEEQKILTKNEEIAATNKIDRNTLSDVDKEWDELRRQYAPKNQTLDEFKAMANGDLDKMKKMSANWTSWDDVGRLEELREKRAQFLFDNENAMNIFQTNGSFDEVADVYPELKQINNEIEALEAKGVISYDFVGNYSTYDRNMTKMFKDAEKTKTSIMDDLHEAKNKWQERTGGVGDFVESDEATSLYDKYGADIAKKAEGVNQWDVAENFQLKNLDNVSQERVAAYNAVLDENPSLEAKLHQHEWLSLTESEKRDVLQAIADKYAAKLGTPMAEIAIEDGEEGVMAWRTRGTNKITFNSKYIQSRGMDSISGTLVHEYGHVVDGLDPNAGALGSQYSYYASKVHSNIDEEGYRVALTEQSSYKIGDVVADAVAARKMANPFSDGISHLYKFDSVFDAKGGVTSADLSGLMNGEQGFVYLRDIDAIADNFDEIYYMLKNQGMTIRSFTHNGTDFYMIGTKGYFDKLLN